MKTSKGYASLLAALLVSAAAASAQNILTNGSFESYGGTGFNSNIGAGLQGWTIGNTGGIDIVLSSGVEPDYWQAADGNVSLSLNWFSPGSISQTVATMLGAPYRLSFSMAAEIYGGQPTRTMDVLWNGVLVSSPSFNYIGQGPNSMGWMQFNYDVVGTGSDTLTFQSTTAENYGPALDDVMLHSVPEPSIIALVGVAGLALLIVGRKKGAQIRPAR